MNHLYGYFRSSAAYRCRIAFYLKNIAYDFTPVHLLKDGGQQKTAQFRRLNPQGLVPCLTMGDLVLTQSLAIIEWLEEQHPVPPLLPSDINLRARVRAFSQVISNDTHPLQNLRVLQYLKTEFGQDQAGVDRWCQTWISDGLMACEALVKDQTHGGDFCFGTTPGLADICLVPQMFSARRFGVDMTGMVQIRKIAAACDALPAFQNAHPSNQPDAQA